MKDLRDFDVMELIVPQLTDRAGRFYIDDEEYLQSFEKQEQAFSKISELLTKEQEMAFSQYVDCVNATAEIVERLVYIQSMKDMFSVICKIC